MQLCVLFVQNHVVPHYNSFWLLTEKIHINVYTPDFEGLPETGLSFLREIFRRTCAREIIFNVAGQGMRQRLWTSLLTEQPNSSDVSDHVGKIKTSLIAAS